MLFPKFHDIYFLFVTKMKLSILLFLIWLFKVSSYETNIDIPSDLKIILAEEAEVSMAEDKNKTSKQLIYEVRFLRSLFKTIVRASALSSIPPVQNISSVINANENDIESEEFVSSAVSTQRQAKTCSMVLGTSSTCELSMISLPMILLRN